MMKLIVNVFKKHEYLFGIISKLTLIGILWLREIKDNFSICINKWVTISKCQCVLETSLSMEMLIIYLINLMNTLRDIFHSVGITTLTDFIYARSIHRFQNK